MNIEIEKRFELTAHDYEIIKNKCDFIYKWLIVDNFLDSKKFSITKSKQKLRIRNWNPELKVWVFNDDNEKIKSLEYEDLEDIKKELKKLNLIFEDLDEILTIETKREKYNINYKWIDYIIDVDRYKYWERYEIEISTNDENLDNWHKLINNFRNYLWLTWIEKKWSWKFWNCAKNENSDLYEVVKKYLNKETWE